MHITFNDTSRKAELGDVVELQNQEQEVVECQETGVLMLNIDADELAQGDLTFIKKLGLTISNPDTEKPVALGVDYEDNTIGAAILGFLAGTLADTDDGDDDSPFFSGGSFGGSSSFGGFSGSFGGFGGGSFGGGGASGSF